MAQPSGEHGGQTLTAKVNARTHVDGCVDTNVIARRFATNFMKVYSCNNQQRAQ